VDLILVSADGVKINAHRQNLAVHSIIFADADTISTPGAKPELIQLSETSEASGKREFT
jgi:hypothetical protein